MAPAQDSSFVKYGALALLVLQNTALVLLLRYSRIAAGPRYIPSTAVASMELVKFVVCLLVLLAQAGSLSRLLRVLDAEVVQKPFEVVKLAVPSLLYMVQNNLLYYALSNLDATPYQVCYQLKILTSAVFSVLLLRKKITPLKWISLVILTIGVAIVKTSQAPAQQSEPQNTFMGFVAVLLASVTSGFAGVYFERVLKGAEASLWMRNIQMGCCSVLLSFGTVFLRDGEVVMQNGFFYGYNGLVLSVVLLQALGGLVVALVVKFADNILKGFAASFSIVTSCVLEMILFDFQPSLGFFVGAVLVNISMVLYGRTPGKRPAAASRRTASDSV